MTDIKAPGLTDSQLKCILHLLGGGVIRIVDDQPTVGFVAEQFKTGVIGDSNVLLESSPSEGEYEWEASDLTVTDLLSLRFERVSEYRYTFISMMVCLSDNPEFRACCASELHKEFKVADGVLYCRPYDTDPDSTDWVVSTVSKAMMEANWAIVAPTGDVV
jgi:hypothetical protein